MQAVDVSDDDLGGWSRELPLGLRAARFWAAHGVRGTSWVPRRIGRLLGRHWRALAPVEPDACLAVDSQNLDIYARILVDGGWEPHVLEACARVTRPGDVVHDVGASAGFLSIALAARFGGGIRVEAFEPQPTLARHLAVSARLSGLASSLTVLPCLIGDRDGNAELFVPSHSVHASVVAREPGANVLVCPIRRLDTLVAAGEIAPPDVLKLDVEGAELAALRGAAAVLRDHAPYVVFEANENMARFGFELADLRAAFPEESGYRFEPIVAGGLDFLAVPAVRPPPRAPEPEPSARPPGPR